MISSRLSEITFASLSALVGQARESRTLEFKRDMPDITKVIQGVAAFANTAGGDFVIGIRTTPDGVAEGIDGIAIDNVDREILRLDQAIRSGLDPRLPQLDFRAVPCAAPGHYVLMLRTPRSWVAPHMVEANGRFYGRNANGKYPLDVAELRTAFLLADRAVERMRAFQADRLGKIVSGLAPAAIGAGALVLHLLPAPSPASFTGRDFVAALQRGTHFPLPIYGPSSGAQYRFNLDGIVNFDLIRSEGVYSYAQMFRSGAIEGAFPLSVRQDGSPYFVSSAVTKVIAAVRQYMAVLNSLEAAFPAYALISVCSEKPVFMRTAGDGGFGWVDRGPIVGPCTLLPDVALESPEVDIANCLRPALDALWNAYGFAACDLNLTSTPASDS
jgi:hypothetical protein